MSLMHGHRDLKRFDLNLLVVFDVLMEERSVTRAAQRLGRTQSAVSHALGRLREQLEDPLLVKMAAGMVPSPRALGLIEEIRPILRRIGRTVADRETFDPSASQRVFRLALPDVSTSVFPNLVQSLRRSAAGVALEWVDLSYSTLSDVADGHVDLAFAPDAWRRPDGVEGEPTAPLAISCFARRGHPAFANWSGQAWSRCSHAVVGVAARVANPIMDAASAAGLERTVGARVPHFAAVAPLLARTDLIATLPKIALYEACGPFGLEIRPPPFLIEPMPHALFWSTRLRNDRASMWLRSLVRETLSDAIRSAA